MVYCISVTEKANSSPDALSILTSSEHDCHLLKFPQGKVTSGPGERTSNFSSISYTARNLSLWAKAEYEFPYQEGINDDQASAVVEPRGLGDQCKTTARLSPLKLPVFFCFFDNFLFVV